MLDGNGKIGTVCILMLKCGLGDDICAMPAVAELARENEVTLYTQRPELWQSLPITVVGVDEEGVRCSNGMVLDPSWNHWAIREYNTIYRLSNWGGWEDDGQGFSSRGRIEQMADLLFVRHAEHFDYKSALKPDRKSDSLRYTVVCVESTEHWRSLPFETAREIYEGCKHYEHAVWLSPHPEHERQVKCETWRELLNLIANAERVIAVDNGVAHLAAALGKSLTVVGGMTNVKDIFKQYGTNESIQATHGECRAPCYRNAARGFLFEKCCGKYAEAQCMKSVTSDVVLSVAYNPIN